MTNNKIKEAFEKYIADEIFTKEEVEFGDINKGFEQKSRFFYGGYTAGYAEAEKVWREKIENLAGMMICDPNTAPGLIDEVNKILG